MTNGTSGSALPGLNLVAMPGQRLATLELAREIERRGFAGISVASPFGTIGQCAGLAFATQRITFASAIAPIYAETVDEFAQSAAYLHEVSAGRFQFGIGIAHGPAHIRMGVTPGRPLGDVRAFVTKFRACTEYGPLPPIILATLRRRMVALAGCIGDSSWPIRSTIKGIGAGASSAMVNAPAMSDVASASRDWSLTSSVQRTSPARTGSPTFLAKTTPTAGSIVESTRARPAPRSIVAWPIGRARSSPT